MAVYAYHALDHRQRPSNGTIIADSARLARDQLRERGLLVREVVEHHPRVSRWAAWSRPRGVSGRLATTIRELATLLSVGVSVVDALETLGQQHRGAFRTALLHLRERVTAGASLAEAMQAQSDVFDELTRRMVEVGENAGNLETVLEQLADYQERSLQWKDRVVSALMYPAIVLCVSGGVCLFLMTVVVPMLLTSLVEAGRPLPWPTRILQGGSHLLLHHGWWLGLGSGGLVLAAMAFLRTERGQRTSQLVFLRLPLIGAMTQKQAVSRIAMVVATLMRSGIVYLQAVEIAARSSSNLIFREALTQSNARVLAGQDIGTALAETRVFPPLVVHVFAVGQASGRLEDMLDRLAENYDRQVATLSTRLAAVMEPLLILVLAVFVGFILFATMLPILEAGNVLS